MTDFGIAKRLSEVRGLIALASSPEHRTLAAPEQRWPRETILLAPRPMYTQSAQFFTRCHWPAAVDSESLAAIMKQLCLRPTSPPG